MENNIYIRNTVGVTVLNVKVQENTKYNVWVKEMPENAEVIPAVVKELLSKKESSSLVGNEELFSMKIFQEFCLTCTYVTGNVDFYAATLLQMIILNIVFEEYRRLVYKEFGVNVTTVGKTLSTWSSICDACERIISDGVRDKLLSDKTAMKGVVLC